MKVGKTPGGRRRASSRYRAKPNHSGARLKWIRIEAQWTPGVFATLVRQAGRELGQPNECSAQLVRDWEDGQLIDCDPVYRDAVAKVTGVRFDLLCSPWTAYPLSPKSVAEAAAVTPVSAAVSSVPDVPMRVLLRTWRETKHLTQEEMAELVHNFGESMGEPNACTKRLVQKWESGHHASVNHSYVRILTKLTGIPAETLNPHHTDALPYVSTVPPDTVLELINHFMEMLNVLRVNVIMGHKAGEDDSKSDL